MGGHSEQASLGEKVFWILAYSFCSSSMLVINKLAVQNLPLPTVVSGAQLFISAAVVVVMQVCGQKVMGPMDKTKVLPFMLYTAMFAGGLFANMKALLYDTKTDQLQGFGLSIQERKKLLSHVEKYKRGLWAPRELRR